MPPQADLLLLLPPLTSSHSQILPSPAGVHSHSFPSTPKALAARTHKPILSEIVFCCPNSVQKVRKVLHIPELMCCLGIIIYCC